MQTSSALSEIADLLAAADPARVVAFRASETTRQRVAHLIREEKNGGLTEEEASELSHSLAAEHLMRLAKARAAQHLASGMNPAGRAVEAPFGER